MTSTLLSIIIICTESDWMLGFRSQSYSEAVSAVEVEGDPTSAVDGDSSLEIFSFFKVSGRFDITSVIRSASNLFADLIFFFEMESFR